MKTREELTVPDIFFMTNGDYLTDEELESHKERLHDIESASYSNDLVEKIVTAPTEKQHKCEYCHKEKNINLTKTSYLEISLDNKVNVCEKRKFDGKHWQVGTVDFNYCPMCGRRLSDE